MRSREPPVQNVLQRHSRRQGQMTGKTAVANLVVGAERVAAPNMRKKPSFAPLRF